MKGRQGVINLKHGWTKRRKDGGWTGKIQQLGNGYMTDGRALYQCGWLSERICKDEQVMERCNDRGTMGTYRDRFWEWEMVAWGYTDENKNIYTVKPSKTKFSQHIKI